CELHPEPLESLETLFRSDKQVGIHHLDGFTGLKALLPPKERRGLVLIDPPYEQEQEIAAILAGLAEAQSRWETGIYAVWYPITPRAQHERFLKQLKASGIRRIFRAELDIGSAATGAMTGNGMVVIRPPWQFDSEVEQLLPWLRQTLAGEDGRADCGWLVGE
ncbi:MAG TPA: 23S rRNA (adenine(2030)-N(6))-methyltransferase RlmJ, partial [Mariprofundaceae bacterium]|nr:23S rRNA (adenine(2030)-N(6))-methyltransferase RlmJ [Mariprofundaceae bacterium]